MTRLIGISAWALVLLSPLTDYASGCDSPVPVAAAYYPAPAIYAPPVLNYVPMPVCAPSLRAAGA